MERVPDSVGKLKGKDGIVEIETLENIFSYFYKKIVNLGIYNPKPFSDHLSEYSSTLSDREKDEIVQKLLKPNNLKDIQNLNKLEEAKLIFLLFNHIWRSWWAITKSDKNTLTNIIQTLQNKHLENDKIENDCFSIFLNKILNSFGRVQNKIRIMENVDPKNEEYNPLKSNFNTIEITSKKRKLHPDHKSFLKKRIKDWSDLFWYDVRITDPLDRRFSSLAGDAIAVFSPIYIDEKWKCKSGWYIEKIIFLNKEYQENDWDPIKYKLNKEPLTLSEVSENRDFLLSDKSEETPLAIEMIITIPEVTEKIKEMIFPVEIHNISFKSFVQLCKFLLMSDVKEEDFKEAYNKIGLIGMNPRKVKEEFLKSFLANAEDQVAMKAVIKSIQNTDFRDVQKIVDSFSNLLIFDESFTNTLEENVENYNIELKKEQKPYIPFGISRNVKSLEKVLKWEKKLAKPMDILTWVFWIENQKIKDFPLVVCDEMQVSNYMLADSNLSKEKALKIAQETGEMEKDFYNKIINWFQLKNINVKNYEAFSKNEDFEKNKNLLTQISKNPLFKDAFEKLTHSIINSEKQWQDSLEIKKYTLTEIAWILSENKSKISHPNEAKFGYDPLSFIILSLEKNNCNWNNQESLEILLKKILNKTENILSEKIKPSLDEEKHYWTEWKRFLFWEKKWKEYVVNPAFKDYKQWKVGKTKSIELPIEKFICPLNISSKSVWLMKNKQTSISFKEPYSTYFSKGEKFEIQDLLDSPQLLLLKNSSSYVSILNTLPQKKQKEYLYKVLYPLLREFLVMIKNQDEKLYSKYVKELKDKQTIIGIFKFIQDNIIEKCFSEE